MKINRIKMNTESASPDGCYKEGQEYDVPGEIPLKTAKDFVAGGYAEDLTPKQPSKKKAATQAESTPPENASLNLDNAETRSTDTGTDGGTDTDADTDTDGDRSESNT